MLATLGLENEVVGITRFCVHPSTWKQSKVIVGGTKHVNVERIQALSPDLILANKEENARKNIEQLEAIAPVYVTEVSTLSDALNMIRTVGCLTAREAQSEALIDKIRYAFNELPGFEKRRALYLIWRRPYMSVGGDTFIHDMMQYAGFENVMASWQRYPEVCLEQMRTLNPEVVLLASEPYPFKAKHVEELREWVPQARMVLVDGEMFSWYGSRLQYAPAYFKHLRQEIA